MEPSKKLRIMIIDDDPEMTELFKMMLGRTGHELLIYHDPTACSLLESPQCECPRDEPCADILIADIMMPVMTGIEFLKLQNVRGCKISPSHKAVMSASSLREHKSAVAALGCHFIEKPFKINDVLSWIDQCAKKSSVEEVAQK